jgi:uncharacterized radical SAM protein YgiQ
MGERPIREVAARLARGESAREIRDVPGTAVKLDLGVGSLNSEYLVIPPFKEVSSDKRRYAEAFRLLYQEQDPFLGTSIAQLHPKTMVVQNPPSQPLCPDELDHVYELPYAREAHPSYREPVPALDPVRFSITSHRGCFGSCSFCALALHQGRMVQSRSLESIVREATGLSKMPGFKGIIQDVGGPTANMYGLSCARWKHGACRDRDCSDCPSLDVDHSRQAEMLRRLRKIPGVRKVFIGSGIRHDLVIEDRSSYLRELCQHHVSGHLKIAPEHIVSTVTARMKKPPVKALEVFRRKFEALSRELGKEQYILPYFMSGHPGCTVLDMIALAEYIRDNNLYTEQVQDFTPTPMTVSTAMYHTGMDPFTLEPVHVPRGREKRIQRAIIQYRDQKNWKLVREGLRMAGREDLIGYGQRCLVSPKDDL